MQKQSLRACDCIETVIEEYSKTVFGIALSMTRNRADAEDVFQDVFLIYHRKHPCFHDEGHRKAWLIRTAINCSRKVTASTWRQKTVPLTEAQEVSSLCLFRSDEENLLYDALCRLPALYRAVLHLFYIEDMSVEMVAAALNRKPGAVKTQLSRGREMLRKELKGADFDE